MSCVAALVVGRSAVEDEAAQSGAPEGGLGISQPRGRRSYIKVRALGAFFISVFRGRVTRCL